MLLFGVIIPTVQQRSEIPEGLMNYPVVRDPDGDDEFYLLNYEPS
jgi:hypothetical protein